MSAASARTAVAPWAICPPLDSAAWQAGITATRICRRVVSVVERMTPDNLKGTVARYRVARALQDVT